MGIDTKPPVPIASDWEIHSHQDKELVKGLGLTSATMLVMGSMIGSGIFIVSSEISREVNSPALLIAAWLVTGFMTIVGALSYGELAAMMPSTIVQKIVICTCITDFAITPEISPMTIYQIR